MKLSIILVLLLGIVCSAKANPSAVEDIVSSMKNSFNALSSKRDQWFSNYSQMKKLSEADRARIEELLLVSKMAVPMVWYLYTSEVMLQKKNFPKLVSEQVDQILPYQKEFTPRPYSSHIELTMQIQEKSDFQISIMRVIDQQNILILHIDYNNRIISFNYQNEDDSIIERTRVEGENFPPIAPGTPFRVNIQIAEDCVFTSFWVGDLTMATPMPLPMKYSWCSKVYPPRPSSHSIGIEDTSDTQEEAEASDEIEDLEPKDVRVTSVVIYDGVLIQ